MCRIFNGSNILRGALLSRIFRKYSAFQAQIFHSDHNILSVNEKYSTQIENILEPKYSKNIQKYKNYTKLTKNKNIRP